MLFEGGPADEIVAPQVRPAFRIVALHNLPVSLLLCPDLLRVAAFLRMHLRERASAQNRQGNHCSAKNCSAHGFSSLSSAVILRNNIAAPTSSRTRSDALADTSRPRRRSAA